MEINLSKYNRHWDKGYAYPYPKKRKAFKPLLSYLGKRQIVEITGLRRTGKSTLIFQLINNLLEKSVDPFSIFYFTFDEEQPTIEFLLRQYSIQTGIDYKKDKIYLFLDEIQKLENFQNQIKVFYDLYPNIKFIISGSTSLFIKKKSRESLAGRIFSYVLKPLAFDEYLMFKEKENLLKKPQIFGKELNAEFTTYLNSQFVESIFLKTPAEKKEYFSSIIKKIVYEDLQSVFKFDNPQILWRMCQYIAQKPGCIINNVNLAAEFGINNKTVALYLSYLEDAFLIKKLYNFSRNLISSEKRLKKYYLASPSFSASLVDFYDYPLLFENYIISVFDTGYFFKDAYGHEVDFVNLDEKRVILPLEAKYREKLKGNDTDNLNIFLDKYSLKYGIIAYRGNKKEVIKIKDKTILVLPYYQLNEYLIS